MNEGTSCWAGVAGYIPLPWYWWSDLTWKKPPFVKKQLLCLQLAHFLVRSRGQMRDAGQIDKNYPSRFVNCINCMNGKLRIDRCLKSFGSFMTKLLQCKVHERKARRSAQSDLEPASGEAPSKTIVFFIPKLSASMEIYTCSRAPPYIHKCVGLLVNA